MSCQERRYVLIFPKLSDIMTDGVRNGELLKWSKRRDSKSRRALTASPGFESLTLRHRRRKPVMSCGPASGTTSTDRLFLLLQLEPACAGLRVGPVSHSGIFSVKHTQKAGPRKAGPCFLAERMIRFAQFFCERGIPSPLALTPYKILSWPGPRRANPWH